MRLNTLSGTVLALVLVAGTAAAQDKPNFSGEWKMNAARSDFGLLPAPASITRTIAHKEPSLSIVETQEAGAGPQTMTRKYTTDGKNVTFESGGAEVRGSAVWDGNTIVVDSKVEIAVLHFLDRMALSNDGKILTSTIRITSPEGTVDLSVVFERQ